MPHRDEKKDRPPIEKETIHVTVTPKDRGNPDHQTYRRKVKDNLTREVKKALDDNRPGGAGKQLDAAGKKIDEAKRQVSPDLVEKIRVKVEGEVGGGQVEHEVTVEPTGED